MAYYSRLGWTGLCLIMFLQICTGDNTHTGHHNAKDRFSLEILDNKESHSDESNNNNKVEKSVSPTQCVCSWSLNTAESLCSKNKNVKPASGASSEGYIDPSLLMQGDQAAHKKTQDELLVSQQVQINQLTQVSTISFFSIE